MWSFSVPESGGQLSDHFTLPQDHTGRAADHGDSATEHADALLGTGPCMAHPPDGLMEEDSVTADDHHCADDGGHVSPGLRHQAWTELECCVPSEGNQVNPGDQRPNAVEDHIGKKNKLGPMHINRSEAITQEW